jgi:hypothetical protein
VTLFDRQRRFRAILWSLLALLVGAPAGAFAQTSSAAQLHISGDVPNHLDLSVADLAAFQRQTIHVTDEKGIQAE